MSNAVAHADHDHAHAAHHPALQHHFDTMAQQKEAAVIGMWVFLLTEILFFGGLFVAYMGGLHFWWPKMTGRLYNESGAKASAILVFVGFNLTFFPQFVLGYLGMPRRYHSYPEEWQVLNVLSSAGASILALGYVLPAFYFTYSLVKGKAASANPWGAKGLEWTIPSPPPTFNFDEDVVVDEPAYNYKPGREVHVG